LVLVVLTAVWYLENIRLIRAFRYYCMTVMKLI
jgi:hypothetical protein